MTKNVKMKAHVQAELFEQTGVNDRGEIESVEPKENEWVELEHVFEKIVHFTNGYHLRVHFDKLIVAMKDGIEVEGAAN